LITGAVVAVAVAVSVGGSAVIVGVWLGVGETVGVLVGVAVSVGTAVALSVIVGVGIYVTVAARTGTGSVGLLSGWSTLCTCQTNKLTGIKNIRINPIRRRIHPPLPKDRLLSLSGERPSNNVNL
jgi:hypothetical protein